MSPNTQYLKDIYDRMTSERILHFLSLTGLLWLTAVIALYYLWHKPLTPALAFALIQTAWSVLASAAILVLAGGLGAKLAPLPQEPPLVRVAIQGAMGLGILATGLLLLGVTAGFNPWQLAAGLAAGLIILIRSVLHWVADWRELGKLWTRSGRFGKLVGTGVVLILLLDLLTALAPPLKFDALVYHLSLPQIYLDGGRFFYVPEIMFWGMPQIGELLYTYAMAISGIQGATVLGWVAGVLSIIGLFSLVESRLGLRSAWISLAALLSGFSLATSLAWAYVDWLALLFGLGFLAALNGWRDSGTQSWILLAGAMAGFAFGVKYTAGILLFPGVLTLAFSDQGAFRPVERLKAVVVFLGVAGLVAAPWLLKNWIATGNPFYPLFFPGGAMDALRLELYQGGEPWGGWADLLFLPLRAALWGVEHGPGYMTSMGPLLVGLGLLVLLPASTSSNHERWRLVGSAAWIAIPVLIVWAVAGRFTGYLLQTRLYFAAFPAFAVLAAGGYQRISQMRLPGLRLGRVVSALIILVFGLNLLEVGTTSVRQGALPYLLGQTTREDYINQNLGWYGPAMKTARELPEGSQVLMLWETRSLDCLPACDSDEVIDRWLDDRDKYQTAESILNSWRMAGYSHLLYYQVGAEFVRGMPGPYTSEDWKALDSLLGSLAPPLRFGEAYELYSLRP